MKVSQFGYRNRHISKLIAFMLALTLILPAGFNPIFGANAESAEDAFQTLASSDSDNEIYIENPIIEMTKKDKHSVIITVAGITTADADAWAKALKWDLKRSAEDSPQWKYGDKTKELFNNIYTGDSLENWKKWGYNGSGVNAAPLFSEMVVTGAVISDPGVGADVIRVEMSFENELFFTDDKGVGTFNASGTAHRNVPAVFIGDYVLSAAVEGGEGVEDEVVAEGMMNFRTYETYRTYAELKAELDEIEKAALANGRYMDVDVFGQSEGGFDQYYVTFAASEDVVDDYLELTERAETEPATVQAELAAGTLGDYALPFHINNIHPDENPGSDAPINFLWKLATQDEIAYSEIEDFEDGVTVPNDLYTTKAIEGWSHDYGRLGESQGSLDVNDTYAIADETFDVDEMLKDVFFIITPNENPDGRTVNSRRNMNGFDLNRDGSFQTQKETYNMMQLISKWNPAVLVEFHGFVSDFLIEPCTPPHEPNLEYDILIENFYKGAEAFGNAALGSLADMYPKTEGLPSFSKYHIPLRDGFKAGKWDAWDDLSTNYTPSYAMLNSNSFGYTIETPYSNQASTDLLEYGLYGLVTFVSDNKDEIFDGQLEFFKRGIENVDVSTEEGNKLESYYVDLGDKLLEDDQWRPKYTGEGETGKFFPEYYIIPVDKDAQRNPAAAAEIEHFLYRNDVRIKVLNKDTLIDGINYKEGTLVVDMHQAKRDYANAVLWDGINSSFFSGLYSESVVSHPKLRGFDCIAIAKAGAIPAANLTVQSTPRAAVSALSGDASKPAVIIKNNGIEAVRAVNSILAGGKDVGFVSSGAFKGNFLVEKSVFDQYSKDFALVGDSVSKAGGDVYKLVEPKVYIAGRVKEYNVDVAAEDDYYSGWFSEGYGAKNWTNIHSNEASNFDVMAFGKQMNFKIAETPAAASIIVGASAVNSGQYGADALAAVKAGKPYIATGASPLSLIRSNILAGTGFAFLNVSGAESLHTVDYPSGSVITAPQIQSGDDIIYSYGGAYITAVPEGATILIKAKTAAENFHIAGCFPGVSDENLGGKAEAFSYQGKNEAGEDVDVTVFANSIVRKAHQQDDYLFATSAIYSKSLGEAWEAFSGTEDTSATQYKVSFDAKGGSPVPAEQTVSENGFAAKPDDPARMGNKFMGWFLGLDASAFDFETTPITADILLTAKWRATGTFPVTSSDNNNTPNTQAPAETGAEVPTTSDSAVNTPDTSAPTGTLAAFRDASAISGWALPFLEELIAAGVISGRSDGSLDPKGEVTRAEFTKMLVLALDIKAGGEAVVFSDDVKDGDWHKTFVDIASSNGLIQGISGTSFAPNNKITRQDLCVIMYRALAALNITLPAPDGGVFPDDGAIADYAKDAVSMLKQIGIVSGREDGRFDPEAYASREETAKIISGIRAYVSSQTVGSATADGPATADEAGAADGSAAAAGAADGSATADEAAATE
ncbi:MAG: S-layer homology domain-containing protein [Clostridiales Family XIII bacterium]|nr:S-layer homology domain-containing protein [Clostridiales Family XIII bacterium]